MMNTIQMAMPNTASKRDEPHTSSTTTSASQTKLSNCIGVRSQASKCVQAVGFLRLQNVPGVCPIIAPSEMFCSRL